MGIYRDAPRQQKTPLQLERDSSEVDEISLRRYSAGSGDAWPGFAFMLPGAGFGCLQAISL
jgi:hypothetical protein